MQRTILPARPLRLRLSYQIKHHLFAIFVGLFGLAMIAGIPFWVLELREAGRDQEVWDHGTPAIDASIEGSQHSNAGLSWLFAWYNLRVSYTDEAGVSHHGERSFTTALGAVDPDQDLEVRYDPAHRDRFAVSWVITARGTRYRGGIAIILLAAAMGYAFLRITRHELRKIARERKIAATGDEHQLRARSQLVIRGKAKSKTRYVLQPDPDDQAVAMRTYEHEGPRLLDIGSDGSRVIVLVLPGERQPPLLVHHDLFPLVVTPEERALIDAASPPAASDSEPLIANEL